MLNAINRLHKVVRKHRSTQTRKTNFQRASAKTTLKAATIQLQRTCMSDVHKVRLSRSSCMMRVLSLYDSSPRVSNSAIASSKACSVDQNVSITTENQTLTNYKLELHQSNEANSRSQCVHSRKNQDPHDYTAKRTDLLSESACAVWGVQNFVVEH